VLRRADGGEPYQSRDERDACDLGDLVRLCANALDAAWQGSRGYNEALSDYQHQRDEEVLPIYEFTGQIGDLATPPPPQMQELLGAIAGNQKPTSLTCG
jgi:hypothetical protein